MNKETMEDRLFEIAEEHCTHNCHKEKSCGCLYYKIKDVLQKEIEKAVEERDKEIMVNISLLRQWINEERIDDPKKLITNKNIQDILKTYIKKGE